MKIDLLRFIVCPACGKELEFQSLRDYPRENEDIETGTLRCKGCRSHYPIIESVPRLFAQAQEDAKVLKTRKSFGWEWLRYPVSSRPDDKEIFLEETQTAEEDWRGRFALDAGCGMGRYARVALSLGAEVVAFDLSDSLVRLVGEARQNARLHVVQGDLLRPPFKAGIFDAVYSQGVIHHTANTRGAFDAVALLVKPGGFLSVWVYGTPGSWESFRTNPLKSTRAFLKKILPAVWVFVWLRQILSDTLRVLTTRMPVPLLYALCYPLTMLGWVPVLKYLTFSVEPKFRVRLTENFDWLAPPFQTKHTKEELGGWFESAGYEVLRNLSHGVVPKPGILGRRK